MRFGKLICTSMLILFSSTAFAEPAEVLIDETLFTCFDANGQVTLGAARLHRVDTKSDTGEIVYSINGECSEPCPLEAAHYDNANTGAICTGDAPYFQMVIAPSCRTKLKCQNFPFE